MLKALIVEDEIALRLIYDRVLLSYDYEVEYLSDGQSAMHYLQTIDHAPNLILMDMLLPDDSGQALFDYLVAHRGEYATTSFILTSSAPHFASYVENLPRAHFVRKPLLPRQFITLMKKIQEAGV